MPIIQMTPEVTAFATPVAESTASLGNYWWYFVIFGLFFAFLTFVQVLFSKAENKKSGWILPGLAFGTALVAVLLLLLIGSSIDFMQALKTFLVFSAPAYPWLIIYVIVRIIMSKKK